MLDNFAMLRRLGLSPLAPISPIRVFTLVMAVVFCVEAAIMILLPRLPTWTRGEFSDSLIDATLLSFIISPVLWLLAIRPLVQVFKERGRLLQGTLELQEQERSRVARDLHDGIGQHLTALMVGLRSIASASDLEAAHECAVELRELSATAHEEVRRLAHGLRPAVLEELGLVPAIERFCRNFERSHGLTVILEYHSTARFSPGAETSIFRIVQEALNNVAKHAQAHTINVTISESDGSMMLVIADDGKGIESRRSIADGNSGGTGLRGISERVFLLNGRFKLTSELAKGTRLDIAIPLKSYSANSYTANS